MRRYCLVPIFALTVLLYAVAFVRAAPRTKVTVETLAGKVVVHPGGSRRSETLGPGKNLKKNDKITTGTGAALGLAFSSGGSLQVGEKSKFVLDEVVFSRRVNAWRITLGCERGFLDISVPLGREQKNDWYVKTPLADVRIRQGRGTVQVTDTAIVVEAFSRALEIRRRNKPTPVTLPAQMQAVISRGTRRVEIIDAGRELVRSEMTVSHAPRKKPEARPPVRLVSAAEKVPSKDTIPIFSGRTVAVYDVYSEEIEESELHYLEQFIVSRLSQQTGCHIISEEEIVQLLQEEGNETLEECETDSCCVRVGMLIGAEYMITGDVGKVGSRLLLRLKALDVTRQKVVHEVTGAVVEDPGKFIDVLPSMIDDLKELPRSTYLEIYSHLREDQQSPGGMKWIEGGTFMMGSPVGKGEKDEWPQHAVTLKGFYIDRYEVTKQEFERVMGINTSAFKGCLHCPVDNVTWAEADEYCRRIEKRLPSEAEWEYVCRAGREEVFSTGTTMSSEDANFNGAHPYGGARKGPYRKKVLPGGSFAPNRWGIYDMHGNVWEWCADWYDEKYYRKSPADSPKGPKKGTFRVLRGGGWVSDANCLRCANRIGYKPSIRFNIFGFRCVKDGEPPAKADSD